jgi:hypothetical protein
MRMIRQASFSTHAEAEQDDRAREWAMTPQQRLRDLEVLRQQRYPNGIAPRLQRTAELLECPPR